MIRRLMAALCFATWVWAQSSAITGVIRDRTQSPIPNAAVTIVNTQTGIATSATSNDTGAFRVNSLLPGTYRIEASAPAFETLMHHGIVLATGQTLAIELTLQVGGL